ncbi:hypothetical protein PRN20_08620 [Devosia sp. ZB163]|uniref:flavodoxin family protein n=1 Tax=Devosia sp. ZB163 TaxID=3025938 RepID=UPI002361615B|nr:hypothetical protein [Devosia sp. ZB163]MDC9823795.1 hypothetical protein [Devosia sp. ZB163]
MRAAIVYFSQTGKTAAVADALGAQLDAELIRLTCPAYAGTLGRFRKAWDIFTRGCPSIDREPLVDGWDLVVVAGPVWDARAAPPVLSALRRLRGKTRRLAMFVTCDGRVPTSPPETAMEEMVRKWDLPVLTTRIFRRDDIRTAAFAGNVTSFANELTLLMRLHGRDEARPAPPARLPVNGAAELLLGS